LHNLYATVCALWRACVLAWSCTSVCANVMLGNACMACQGGWHMGALRGTLLTQPGLGASQVLFARVVES
jgi:hypothetical protein